jgi:hypothetical protein
MRRLRTSKNLGFFEVRFPGKRPWRAFSTASQTRYPEVCSQPDNSGSKSRPGHEVFNTGIPESGQKIDGSPKCRGPTGSIRVGDNIENSATLGVVTPYPPDVFKADSIAIRAARCSEVTDRVRRQQGLCRSRSSLVSQPLLHCRPVRHIHARWRPPGWQRFVRVPPEGPAR